MRLRSKACFKRMGKRGGLDELAHHIVRLKGRNVDNRSRASIQQRTASGEEGFKELLVGEKKMELRNPRIHNDVFSHKGRGTQGHRPDDPSVLQGPTGDLCVAESSRYPTPVRKKLPNIIKP